MVEYCRCGHNKNRHQFHKLDDWRVIVLPAGTTVTTSEESERIISVCAACDCTKYIPRVMKQTLSRQLDNILSDTSDGG